MPEQTATNPQTGERVVLRNGQWVPMGQGAPVQQVPQRADPIIRPVAQPAPITPVQQAAMDRAAEASARAEESAARARQGNPGPGFRMNPDGSAAPIPGGVADPAATQSRVNQTTSAALLRAAGIEPGSPNDRIVDLIQGSTSGGLQRAAANTYGYVTGESTSGMENIAALQTIASDLTLALTGGSLGSQISNSDRDFIVQRIGNIADPNVPADQRIAAWREVRRRMESAIGAQPNQQRDPTGPLSQRGSPASAFPNGGNGPQGGGGGGPGGGNGVVTLRDMYPQGAQLGMDVPEASVTGEGVLQQLGITPEQERQMVGAFNAAARSRRNSFTTQDARAIFEAAGLPVPADAELAAAVEQVRSGGTFSGYDTRALEADRQAELDAEIERRNINPEDVGRTSGVSAVMGSGFGQADELAGADAFASAVGNLENPFDAYTFNRDVARRIYERGKAENPRASMISEIGGALLTGGIRAAPAAMRAARPVAAAAREGAILGGVAGFGYGEGPAGSIGGAIVGAGTGAAMGAGVSAGARALAPTARRVANAFRSNAVRPNAGDVNAVVQAGERMDVPVRRADVDPNVRDTRAQVLQSPAGQAVRAVEADDLAAMEQALAARTGSEGVTPDRLALGDSVQSGTRRVIDRARARASAIYKRAFRASEGAEIVPTNMIAAIDENIAELTRNGATQNAASINFLRGVRNDAMNGGPQATGILDSAGKPIMRGPKGLSIEALRSQRTNLRGNINQAGLSMTDMERRMTNVLTAASSDIEAGLVNNADALAMFREADGLWREQADFTNSIGRRILGTDNQPVSPETAAQRIAAFVRGDFNRARTLFAELPSATRADISAQVAANLGRNAKGEFSLAQFLTHTSTGRGGLLDERTTRLIFGEGGVQAIQDLRTLAGAKVAATERTNYSNTGGIINRMGRGLRTMMMGALGLSEGGATGGAVAITASKLMERLGEGRAVRLLTNPDFTTWLRRLPETDNPRAIDGAFRRLRNVASANAQFSSDVEAFQQALLSSANDNAVGASKVAAQEEQEPQQ